MCTCTACHVIGRVCCLRRPSAAQSPGLGKSTKGQPPRLSYSHSWGVTQACGRDESQELEPSPPWPQTPFQKQNAASLRGRGADVRHLGPPEESEPTREKTKPYR